MDDQVFIVRSGQWQIIVGGQVVPATFNDKGVALAAIEVERRRQAIRRNS